MISVPSLIRDYLREDSHKKNIRIHFPNYERTDICNDQIVINTVQFTESLCSQNKLKFGLCEAPMFECEVVGVGNITGAIIEVSCEIYCPASVTGAVFRTDLQAYVYPIPYGTFTVTEAKRQSDMNHRKITAYGGPAAIDWKPGALETSKLLYSSTTDAPTYTPNLGYLIVENGVHILDGLLDKSLISAATDQYLSTLGIIYTDDYTFRIQTMDKVYPFGVSGYNNDPDALYMEEGDRVPEYTFEYLYALLEPFFSQFGRDTFYKFLSKYPNLKDRVIGELKGVVEYTVNNNGVNHVNKASLNDDYCFYPYINDFYGSSSGVTRYMYFRMPYKLILTATETRTSITHRREFVLFEDGQSGEKLYKYKYSADAPAWTAYRLSIPTVYDPTALYPEHLSLNYYYRANFEDIDLRELCGDIAELLGTIVSFTRDGFEAKFINLKQLFSLLPSGALYPGQQLYPGATTGGKLLPRYYQTCWYQDEYELPFGAVTCKYKDTNNKDCSYTLFLTGFDEAISGTYKTYEIENNAIISGYTWTEAQIQAICETIADNIAGVTYMPVEFTGMGYPYVESGDTFEILTPNNDSIVTIVLNRTLSGEQVLTDTYKSV